MNMKSAFKKPATYVDYDEQLTWWVKWIATAMAIGCATLSSLDVYPYNVWLGFLAGVGWTWVGWRWGEPALEVINVAMTVVYGTGVVLSLLRILGA